jgi:hypothetical protein
MENVNMPWLTDGVSMEQCHKFPGLKEENPARIFSERRSALFLHDGAFVLSGLRIPREGNEQKR